MFLISEQLVVMLFWDTCLVVSIGQLLHCLASAKGGNRTTMPVASLLDPDPWVTKNSGFLLILFNITMAQSMN